MLQRSLFSSACHTWQTPDEVLELVRRLGPIGLDVCTSAENPTGARIFNVPGEPMQWDVEPGEVCWMNPPYGRELPIWMRTFDRLARDNPACHCVALTTSRSDTAWFVRAWRQAAAVCLWTGRLTFRGATDPAPFASALWYWGPDAHRFCSVFGARGLVQVLR